MIRASAQHARTPPPEVTFSARLVRVGLARHLPAADVRIVEAEIAIRSRCAAQWSHLRCVEHRRLLHRLVIAPRLDHEHLHAVQGENHRRHAATGARSDDDHIILRLCFAFGEDRHWGRRVRTRRGRCSGRSASRAGRSRRGRGVVAQASSRARRTCFRWWGFPGPRSHSNRNDRGGP